MELTEQSKQTLIMFLPRNKIQGFRIYYKYGKAAAGAKKFQIALLNGKQIISRNVLFVAAAAFPDLLEQFLNGRMKENHQIGIGQS